MNENSGMFLCKCDLLVNYLIPDIADKITSLGHCRKDLWVKLVFAFDDITIN